MILHSERAKLCLLFAVRAGNFIEWIPVDKLKTCTAFFFFKTFQFTGIRQVYLKFSSSAIAERFLRY